LPESQGIELIVIAKGDYYIDQFSVVPKVLVLKLCEQILAPVGPEAFTNFAGINRISRWVVPTAKLAGEGEVFPHVRTVGDEKNGVEGTLFEKLVEMLVLGKPDDVPGNGSNIVVTGPRGIELIEHQNLQEHVTDIGVVGELGPK
jgi:hypothetical protein